MVRASVELVRRRPGVRAGAVREARRQVERHKVPVLTRRPPVQVPESPRLRGVRRRAVRRVEEDGLRPRAPAAAEFLGVIPGREPRPKLRGGERVDGVVGLGAGRERLGYGGVDELHSFEVQVLAVCDVLESVGRDVETQDGERLQRLVAAVVLFSVRFRFLDAAEVRPGPRGRVFVQSLHQRREERARGLDEVPLGLHDEERVRRVELDRAAVLGVGARVGGHHRGR
mmetsp:Transcript_13287/g.41043  ORF Transcript_13287/g.41043 Transcript_13287/m.41043 type:complete len:228 (-) Transcript_13287:597-1280(-)